MTIAVAEDDNETTEIANINHTAAGTYTEDIDPVDIKVTATDDDVVAGAAIRVDKTAVRLTEGDDGKTPAVTRVVMVSLAVVPTGDVTVTVVSSAEAAATVDEHRSRLRFELG